MKKLIIYFLIGCMIAITVPSFAMTTNKTNYSNHSMKKTNTKTQSQSEDNYIETFNVDGKKVNFQTKPIILNHTTMVPMKTFFQALGCDVKWINDTQEVIAYKNNMFIKLQINNALAYKNGKPEILDEAPIIKNDQTLVPANFIANTFDMNIQYEPETKTMNITSTNDTNKSLIINNSFYKEQIIKDYGVSIFTPTFWNKLKDSDTSFGYSDDSEFYKLSIDKQKFDKKISLNQFTELQKKYLLKKYGKALSFNGNSTIKTDNFTINMSLISTDKQQNNYKQIKYFIVSGNYGYTINCTYGLTVTDEVAMDLFNDIINTFRINNLTLDSNIEHYFEFEPFFNNGVQINTEIYSNMLVKNSFQIKGSISKESDITEIKALVSKRDNRLEFPLKLNQNNFEGTIYLPFGLGKHNVTILGITKDAKLKPLSEPTILIDNVSTSTLHSDELTTKQELEKIKEIKDRLDDFKKSSPNTKKINVEFDDIKNYYLLQFSLINIDDENIRYIIPSKLINANERDIYNTANYITYNKTSDYSKSYSIFNWLVNNINLVENNKNKNSHINNSIQLLKNKSAEKHEFPILYCSLLRSLEIPSRVIHGYSKNQDLYWTEILINGKWIVSSPVDEILLKEKKSNKYNYFKINKKEYYKKFDKIELLPY